MRISKLNDSVIWQAVVAVLAATLVVVGLLSVAVPTKQYESSNNPRVVVQCLDQSLIPYADLWKNEATRRFDSAVVIECHGGSIEDGKWVMKAGWQPWEKLVPVETVIARYRALYPNRELILISCNPDHIVLHGYPHVWYAKSSIWVIPDRALTPAMMRNGEDRLRWDSGFDPVDASKSRSDLDPDVVGSVFELIEAK